MSTRPTDPRGADRRGSDNADIGYHLDTPARVVTGRCWPAPDTIQRINAYARQRAATGRCVVCGQPTDSPGVTRKATACLSCWILGHEEPFTTALERLEY